MIIRRILAKAYDCRILQDESAFMDKEIFRVALSFNAWRIKIYANVKIRKMIVNVVIVMVN